MLRDLKSSRSWCSFIFAFLAVLLTACTAPAALAPMVTLTPTTTMIVGTMVTVTPTITVTSTPTAMPTAPPTAIPTISIPMLTRTVTPTVAPSETPTQLPPLDAFPDRVIPHPFGVEIHFTQADAYELDRLAAGGFSWIRMDLFWHAIEIAPGRYDFRAYDALVASMAKRGIRVVFILDYGNPLYDYGYPPTSPEGRTAFAQFAATAALHYRGQGVVWEIWNEPNLDHFWVPQANVADYGQLALETIAAIRRVDPTALIVAPATSGFDPPFLRALGEMGLFTQLDAVTVHPYGIGEPENVGEFYVDLARLLHRYNPTWKIPVLSGEWGYPSHNGGLSQGQQAQFLVRQWLVNLTYDINLSIWYDWRNDGADRTELEQNFGTLDHDLSLKPAYSAAQTLLTTLDGYRYLRRIPLENPADYLLLFQKDARVAFALWTTGEARALILPLSVDDVHGVDMLGEAGVVESQGGGLVVDVSQSPRYLLFRPDQAALRLGGWRPYETVQCFAPDVADAGVHAGVRVVFADAPEPQSGTLELRVAGELRGSTSISVPPLDEVHVRVPLDLTGLHGNVPAELTFIPVDETLLPLQKAAVWLCIGAAEPQASP